MAIEPLLSGAELTRVSRGPAVAPVDAEILVRQLVVSDEIQRDPRNVGLLQAGADLRRVADAIVTAELAAGGGRASGQPGAGKATAEVAGADSIRRGAEIAMHVPGPLSLTAPGRELASTL